MAVQPPPQKREVLAAVIDDLKNASNVVALVLGGSDARGVAREDSDRDIGIYYREAARRENLSSRPVSRSFRSATCSGTRSDRL